VAYANDPASTPSAAYAYDRLGRLSSCTRNSLTDTRTYNNVNELLSESFYGGTLSVSDTYDSLLRRSTVGLDGQSTTSLTYTYDTASRLATVVNGLATVTYSYIANSPLVSQVVSKYNSVTKMTTTRQYDSLNRLTSISSV